MYTYLLTIARHAAGIAAGYALAMIGGALGLEVTAEVLAGATELLTWIGAGLLMLGYVAVEKALKPVFRRIGEQPESPAPPTTARL